MNQSAFLSREAGEVAPERSEGVAGSSTPSVGFADISPAMRERNADVD